MLIVAALGGNALLKRGEPMDAATQRANVKRAAASLAELIKAGHRVVITHGNGPQVGLLALQSAAGPKDGAYPLDILGAESEGMIGYLIEQELAALLPEDALLATMLTQIRVDSEDPAFRNPTKFIGPVYDEATARKLADERGWSIRQDGDKWRRTVPSPEPQQILEIGTIRLLTGQGVTVICAGGGGIPVIPHEGGGYIGIEAVIDKDRASALLAAQLGADMLLLLTDVDAVYRNFGKPDAIAIRHAAPGQLDEADFAKGSMGPKIGAACKFTRTTGKLSAIGRLEDAMDILEGRAGTTIGWTD